MFVGRKQELEKLEWLYAKGGFQMMVLYGRRRVGKTTLAKEFVRGKNALYFTALEQSDHDNLSDFTRKMMEFFGLPASFCAVRTKDSWKARYSAARALFMADELLR